MVRKASGVNLSQTNDNDKGKWVSSYGTDILILILILTLLVTHPEDEVKEKEKVFDTFCSSFYSHGAIRLNPENKMKVKTHKRKNMTTRTALNICKVKNAGTIYRSAF